MKSFFAGRKMPVGKFPNILLVQIEIWGNTACNFYHVKSVTRDLNKPLCVFLSYSHLLFLYIIVIKYDCLYNWKHVIIFSLYYIINFSITHRPSCPVNSFSGEWINNFIKILLWTNGETVQLRAVDRIF